MFQLSIAVIQTFSAASSWRLRVWLGKTLSQAKSPSLVLTNHTPLRHHSLTPLALPPFLSFSLSLKPPTHHHIRSPKVRCLISGPSHELQLGLAEGCGSGHGSAAVNERLIEQTHQDSSGLILNCPERR